MKAVRRKRGLASAKAATISPLTTFSSDLLTPEEERELLTNFWDCKNELVRTLIRLKDGKIVLKFTEAAVTIEGRNLFRLKEDLRNNKVEWVNGEVILLSPASLLHQALASFLVKLVGSFVDFLDLGIVLGPSFQMKTGPDLPGRERYATKAARRHAAGSPRCKSDGYRCSVLPIGEYPAETGEPPIRPGASVASIFGECRVD